MQHSDISFSFGKNWQDFVEHHLTPEKIVQAQKHIQDFLEIPSLQGLSFLDIGCGSGLSSLAAFQLGARKIFSFDADPHSVETTRHVKEMAGNPECWTVAQGSILDTQFIQTLEKADIVYSWGVLHHTGNMWESFEQTANLLPDKGLLYISLYRTTPKSDYWVEVKKKYNRAGTAGKRMMEGWYILRYTMLPELLRFKNPFGPIWGQKRVRGMTYLPDLRDWLGGYPYEDAAIEDVLRFARKRLNLELLNIDTRESTVEYLFSKKNMLSQHRENGFGR